ncbi:hypothetical protein [Streptomyces sp. TRM72054]|uniref:DUF7134 domain-containing protein n=1 Tax=Streptomyces sp. TRM72054 TaxID=2870562 RepID=UPI0021AB3626|nr:hypothetical protein [Streptomyces sp. TRM72054]
MEYVRNWLLPALLAVVQVSVWPGLTLLRGAAVEAPQLAVGLAVTASAVAVLGVRRRFPVAAALTIEGMLAAGLVVPDEALLAAMVAGVVALYSVAVRRPAGTAVLVATVLTGSAVLRSLLVYDSPVDIGGEALASFALFAGTVGAGRSRAAGSPDAAPPSANWRGPRPYGSPRPPRNGTASPVNCTTSARITSPPSWSPRTPHAASATAGRN